MKVIATQKLKLNAQTETFTGNMSELGLSEFPELITLVNTKSGGNTILNFIGQDDDTGYYESKQGYKLLIHKNR
jgi:hypothetical protein